MPPGAGTAITTVHVASGVFGADHGTTEMRPAAVGSIGTAGRYDLLWRSARCGMVMCLPCVAATGFTGLSFLEGPLKDCTKLSKTK